MPELHVTRDLCLNGMLVPAEDVAMYLLDPYKVDTSGAADEEKKHKVSLVDLRASGNHTWLQKPMDLPCKWFVRNHGRIPLLQEILQAIRAPKRQDARASRCREYLVALKVRDDEEGRGRVLWFKNESRFVLLAVKATEEGVADLAWFLQEMKKDIAALQEDDIEEEEATATKERRGGVPEVIQGMVSEAMESLQAHPQCATVMFLPSKNAMRMVRKGDKAEKRITIKQLKKLLAKSDASACEDAIQRQFDRLQAEAVEFLDGGGGCNQEPAMPASGLGGGGGAHQEPAVHASGLGGGGDAHQEPAGSAEPASGGANDQDDDDDDDDDSSECLPKNFPEPARIAGVPAADRSDSD